MGRDFPPPPPDERVVLRDLVREVLAELVAPLEARVAELEAYVHQEPEPDPATMAFLSFREKARGVVRRQREKGQMQ